MDPLKKEHDAAEVITTEAPSWRPEVLEGVSEECSLPADFDLDEVWHWFHARLKALGNLTHEEARLTALLNWNEVTVCDAVHAARLENRDADGEGTAMRAHLEFLTAEYLARQTLEDSAIPSPELRPA